MTTSVSDSDSSDEGSERFDRPPSAFLPINAIGHVLGAARGAASGAASRVAAAIGPRGADDQPRYAAFISYSHADMAFARRLHRDLEAYRVPRALVGTLGERGPVPPKLRPVFRDEDELPGASELGPKLQAALRDAGALIVVCSPRAARSAWVDKEIRTFKTLHPDRPVLAVIARGVPGDPAQECFPEALRHALLADGTIDRERPLEPLAPDAQKLDRRAVKLKLVSGLLGIGYGLLANRELRRHRTRIATVASVSTMLVIVLSLLSIAAIGYARVAVAERKRAEAARDEAVRARDLADRRAWLAQRAAQEVRFLTEAAACPSP